MRKISIFILLCLLHKIALSQYGINRDGLLVSTETDTINLKPADTLHVSSNPELRKVFIKELLKTVEQTINNLEDDSVGLREQYAALFCDTFFCRFYDELRRVRDSLRRGVVDSTTTYFPGLQVKRWLDTAHVYYISNLPANKNIKVYSIKPFNDFIYRLYRDATYSNVQGWQMDMAYKKSWRQVEYYYQKSKFYLDSLSNAFGTITTCDIPIIDSFIHEMISLVRDSCRLDTVPWFRCINPQTPRERMGILMNHLHDPMGLRRWLWYTSGIPTMNPLSVTTDNQRYPTPNEHWTVLDSTSYKNVKKMESDSGYFRSFFTTQKLLNDIQIPSGGSGKHKYVKEYYDNIPGYKSKDLPEVLSRRDSVSVWVFNVPVASNLKITAEIKSIPDESNVTTQLNNALDEFPDLSKFSIGTNLTAILQGINAKNKQLAILPIPQPPTITKTGSFLPELDSDRNLEFMSLQWSSRFKRLNEEEDKEVDAIMINAWKIMLKREKAYNEDKRNIILASITYRYRDSCKGCVDTIPHYIIDSFVVKDYCTTLNYFSKSIDTSIENMMKRFGKYLKCVNNCINQVRPKITTLTVIHEYFAKLMAIANRSLPPDTTGLKRLNDENAKYTTAIYRSSLSDSSFEETISISKTVKINNKDSVVIPKKLKFRVGKMHYVDASAGLAFTFTDYTVKEAQAAGLPVVKNGDKMQLNAGINIYPWGLIKVDNRLLPTKPCGFSHRVSIYLGVSISSKPLDNIYTGLGYDVVPGITAIVGAHWYKNTRYQIVNNQVFNQADGLRPAGFVAINIEPATLIKTLLILK